jgi:EsV-1-7 cysteine-rich motif
MAAPFPIRIRHNISEEWCCYNPTPHSPCKECMLRVRPPNLPPARKDRKKQYYMRGEELVWWSGYLTYCLHKKQKSVCGCCSVGLPHKNAVLCRYEGCTTRCTFAGEDGKRKYCKVHAEEGMVSVHNLVCEYPNCKTLPSYGTPAGKRVRCKAHIEEGMVMLSSRKCQFGDCTKQPVFGKPGQKAVRCKAHKEVDMIDVKNRRCGYEGCFTQPCFGFPGGEAQRCTDHREPTMVDVKNLKCADPNCQTQPAFGYPNGSPSHCGPHKLPGMEDVRSRRCEHKGCDKRPGYGLPGQVPRHCYPHRVVGDIKHYRRTCIEDNCQEIALYGLSIPVHCESHHLPDEFDLVQRACVSCSLPEVLNTNGHCSSCDPTTFKRVYLAKQKAIKAFLDEHGPACLYYDQVIKDGCGLERPDIVYDTIVGTHLVVLEVDEGQHRERISECERIRMINVTSSLGIVTLFLRVNPDKYKTLPGQEEVPIKQRYVETLRVLEYWRRNALPPDGHTFVTYLYYDGHSTTDEPKLAKVV